MPDATLRYYTGFLKRGRIESYARFRFGLKRWHSVVGLRVDEPLRAWRMRAWDCGSRTSGRAALPLADARVAERDVLAWWKGQPFDLGLPGYTGYCACCFLKGGGKLVHIIREDPSLTDWWIEQEARVTNRAGPDRRACESPKRFWIDDTYTELKAAALARRDLFDATAEDEDDGASDCICTGAASACRGRNTPLTGRRQAAASGRADGQGMMRVRACLTSRR